MSHTFIQNCCCITLHIIHTSTLATVFTVRVGERNCIIIIVIIIIIFFFNLHLHFVSTPVHSSAAGECGLLPQHNEHRIRSRLQPLFNILLSFHARGFVLVGKNNNNKVLHHQEKKTCIKMEGKTNLSRNLKQFDGLTQLTWPPYLTTDLYVTFHGQWFTVQLHNKSTQSS